MKKRFLLWRLKMAIHSGKFTLNHRFDINYINADLLRIARICEKLIPFEESGEIDNDMIVNIISEA